MSQTLCGLGRASLNIPSYGSSMDRQIEAMLAAASHAIRKWCRRDFSLNSYDELYNGNGDRRLMLRQYPIVSVDAVRYRPVTVCMITNTLASNVQARVTVTSTGLTLMRTAAGLRINDTSITFASNVTITALVAAVKALDNGWSAQVVGDANNYGARPSSDLYVQPSFGQGSQSQGALQCVAGSNAELKMHTYELAGYQWDAKGWLLRAISYTDPELIQPEDLVWPTGINNFRIQYTAGYPEIPEAVQEACAEWTSWMYAQTQRDPALQHQVPASGTTQGWGGMTSGRMSPPPHVRTLLAPYRRILMNTGQS